jgi:hypothetical protein
MTLRKTAPRWSHEAANRQAGDDFFVRPRNASQIEQLRGRKIDLPERAVSGEHGFGLATGRPCSRP